MHNYRDDTRCWIVCLCARPSELSLAVHLRMATPGEAHSSYLHALEMLVLSEAKSDLISSVHKSSQIVGVFFKGPSFARRDQADKSTIPPKLHLRKSCLRFKCFAQRIVFFFFYKGGNVDVWHWSRAVLFPVCHTALQPALITQWTYNTTSTLVNWVAALVLCFTVAQLVLSVQAGDAATSHFNVWRRLPTDSWTPGCLWFGSLVVYQGEVKWFVSPVFVSSSDLASVLIDLFALFYKPTKNNALSEKSPGATLGCRGRTLVYPTVRYLCIYVYCGNKELTTNNRGLELFMAGVGLLVVND